MTICQGTRKFVLVCAVVFAISVIRWAPIQAQRGAAPPVPSIAEQPWRDKTLSPDRRADLLLEKLTLDEKIALVHGAGFSLTPPTPDSPLARSNGGAGFLPGIARYGLPDVNMADFAIGITRGAQNSRYSIALTSTSTEAASCDPQIAGDYGDLICCVLHRQG